MMKYILILFLIIFLSCSSNNTSLREKKWKETELKLKEIRCSKDRLIAEEELKRGNVFAYFDDIESDLFSQYQYYLFQKYNLICRLDNSHYFECQKSVMDSVIFSNYGVNFYKRINGEIAKYFNNKKDNFTPEGYYFTRGTTHYPGGLDSIYSYIDPLIPNVNDCILDNNFVKDAIVLLYIDTVGLIKKVIMKKKVCPSIDRKVCEAFTILPKKFIIPLIYENKHPIIEEIYLKW